MSKHPLHGCYVAVIWIDWYAYHVARFRGLNAVPQLSGRVAGIELVGGIGVHAGLKFREELPVGLPIETLEPHEGWRTVNHWRLARKLWARLSELDPAVVLVPGYYTLPGVAAALWTRLHGSTSVLMTESTSHDLQRVWWKEALKALGMRCLFDWAVCGGKAHLAYLRDLAFPPDRIVSGYDVIDNDMFGNGANQARLTSSAPVTVAAPYFLYVGRFAAEKNIMMLLRSWLKYRQGGGTWPLVLVGAGPEATALRAFAGASAFAADVHFPGLKSSHDLIPYYAFAGCFVLPSTSEPWGLVVNEAMASGLPVLVSTRCGCAADLVHPGSNGFVFDPSDADGLSALLMQVEAMLPEERQRLGCASSELIRGYSPLHFGLSIASILQSQRVDEAVDAILGGSQ